MQICVDQGNSFTKIGVFNNRNLIYQHSFSDDTLQKGLLEICTQYQVASSIISSVREHADELKTSLGKYSPVIELSSKLKLPITLQYETPATLGSDRIANAAGAAARFPLKPVLVVDCGTCLTFSMVLESAFIGGAISPGLSMRYRSLQHFTGKLPLVEPEQDLPPFIGASSKNSIRSGVEHGILAETEGIIAQYCSLFSGLIVILTGGNMTFFEKHLKNPIFAAPYLTLEGLNEILLLNSK